MEKSEKSSKDYYVIDLLHILKSLWRRAWAILLISIVCGAIALSYTVFFIPAQYSSSVLLYVNNNTSIGDITLTTTQINAARQMVDSYIVILQARTTLEDVIDTTGVEGVSYGSLRGMIEAAPVNDTEIFSVTVTTDDPYKAEILANGIAKVLPIHVESVMDGTSMKVVDSAVVNENKVSPNLTANTAIGLVLGFVVSCLLFAIIAMMDDTIRGEDHLVQNYDVPILAKIPDLLFEDSARKYSYYYNDYKSKDKNSPQENAADGEGKEG